MTGLVPPSAGVLDNLSLVADRALYALSRARARIGHPPRHPRDGGGGPRRRGAGPSRGRAVVPRGARRVPRSSTAVASSLYLTVSAPSWIEDPTPLITVLQDAVDPSPSATRSRGSQSSPRSASSSPPMRARGSRSSRRRCASSSSSCWSAARQGSVLQEDHNYWIDTQIVYSVRRVVLELGRRLVENGAVDEGGRRLPPPPRGARRSLGRPARSSSPSDASSSTGSATSSSPPVLGMVPPGPPPDDPMGRAVRRMFGGPPRESDRAGRPPGTPARAASSRPGESSSARGGEASSRGHPRRGDDRAAVDPALRARRGDRHERAGSSATAPSSPAST